MLSLLLMWIAFSFLTGYIAKNQGRNGTKWGLFALAASPIVALAVLIKKGEKEPGEGANVEPDFEIKGE